MALMRWVRLVGWGLGLELLLGLLGVWTLDAAEVWECRRAAGPIVIDGRAEEPAWQQAQPIGPFRRPWDKQAPGPARTATEARLLWDDQFLYFFADLEDHDLFADILEPDGRTWLNDVFELFFWPDPQREPYYEFQVNAAGTKLDIYFARPGVPFEEARRDGTFAWETAVVRRGTLVQRDDRDEGWSVEGRIPWSDFARTGGRPAPGATWRFALCRYDYTAGQAPELSTCAPLARPDFHRREDYAVLRFVSGAAGPASGGLPRRAGVRSSRVIGSPDPPLPYRPRPAFPGLKLNFPIAVDRVPQTDWLLVIVQDQPYDATTVYKFRDDPQAERLEKVLATPGRGTAYGIAFHPHFADNGYLYIGWNGSLDGGPKRTYVTRYVMDRQTLTIDPDSAVEIISWESNGHNGGDLEFGLDGMLYITSGDGTSDSDTNLRGQDLTQLTAKVLRIDVDHPDPGRQYSVPPDNPFVGREGIVPETWAYGLRNPWRITVDPRRGHIWVGNNGQDLWEQIYFVRKGDNYGWSVYEGSHIFYANRKMGPHPLALPAAEHHHSEARSMTGGVVYYGQKLPELHGAYIYGDHSTGRIWGIRHDGTRVTWHKLLADTTFNISGFGLDSRGELLVLDHRGKGQGGIYTLEPTPPQETPPPPFPRRLSESGLFEDVARHQMVEGAVPYSVNAPLWSDGAHKERFFAIPEAALEGFQINLADRHGWNFPDGTVLVKSFAIETVQGDPTSRRWIETRFLTRQEGEWAGYSYRWNEAQTDAELVPAEGLEVELAIDVPDPASGQVRKARQTWRYPSRVECMVCHSRAANFVLGLSTAQMNRTHDYGGIVAHQFQVLADLGLIQPRPRPGANPARRPAASAAPGALLPHEDDPWPRLADPYDEQQPLEARARAYLHANCAMCHVQAGGGNAQMDLSYTAAREKMNVIDVVPLHHKFDLPDARLVAPGHPERSVLLYRMQRRGVGTGQMPQLATYRVDEAAVDLIQRWIASLPTTP
jgi:uncharacterized repeat protein (TIGR03806 family)